MNHTSNGFTLIEVIIYCSITLMLFTSLSSLFTSVEYQEIFIRRHKNDLFNSLSELQVLLNTNHATF